MINNLVGSTFGRMEVIEQAELNKFRGRYYLCKCACGNIKKVLGHNLTNGNTKSCGCLRRDACIKRHWKHGHAQNGKASSIYHSWASAISKCENKANKHYKDYGGRGITVCKEWHDFRTFLRDMGDRPEGLSLDRIDNNGNYEPGNCRWATDKQQMNNTRNHKGRIEELIKENNDLKRKVLEMQKAILYNQQNNRLQKSS